MEKGNFESFNYLARIFLEREILIGKIASRERGPLSAEKEVDNKFIVDRGLQELIGMIDRYFSIDRGGPDSPVRIYRQRLDIFVDQTIGYGGYGKMLTTSVEELKLSLADDVNRFLERKEDLPELRDYLKDFLRLLGGVK